MKKTLFATAALLAMTAGQSYAYTVTFGGQYVTDGSYLSSPIGVNSSNQALPGFFIETFDDPSNTTGETLSVAGSPGTYNIYVPAGGGLVSVPVNDLYIYYGGFGIRQGTVSYAAAPANDRTFFVYTPGQGNSTGSVGVDYSDFINATGDRIDYLGLYWGSIDLYNKIELYNGSTLVQTITGAEVLAAGNGNSGNQFQPGSNVYVNIFFSSLDPEFTSFRFVTDGIAFEADNLVTGYASTPEPATMILFGTGLAGLAGFVRRKRS
jgi:hypothetical protein